MPVTDGGEKTKRKSSIATTNGAVVTAVNDQQANPAPAKRQRVSRACDQCRTAREKCDGIQPICFTCASSNRDCSYTANPKKRGIQPGYIRTLELTLAWTFNNVSGSEEALLAMLGQPEGRSLLSGKDTEGSYKLHRKWRKSQLCKEIDRVLSGAESGTAVEKPSPMSPEDDQLDDGELVESQATAGAAPTPSLQSNGASNPSGSRGNAAHHAVEAIHSPAQLRNLPPRPKPRPQGRSKLTVPSNLWRLLDVYFAYTHCWFPIVEKHDIMKLSYSYPEEGLDISANSLGSGEHAELWSILAVASLQDHAASSSSAPRGDNGTPLLPGDIYNIARSLIPTEQGAHELGHVKALLLLSLVNIGGSNSRAAWLLIGYAVRLAIILGLHQGHQVMGRFVGPDEQGSRAKHVYLACFALDTIVSAHLGKEPFLKREHIDRVGLLDEDGLEEWQPWVGCPDFKPSTQNPAQYNRSPVHTISTFNHIVRILGIVNDSLMGLGNGHTASMHLQQWISSLPPTFKSIQLNQSTAAPTPTLFSLRFIYCCTTMAFAVPSVVPAENVAETFLRFADAFGIPAMLPIFSPLIALAGRTGAFEALPPEMRSKWTTRLTNYRELWRKRESTGSSAPGATDATLSAHVSSTDPVTGMPKPPAYPSPVSQYPASNSTAFSPPPYNSTNTNFPPQPFDNMGQFIPAASSIQSRNAPASQHIPVQQALSPATASKEPALQQTSIIPATNVDTTANVNLSAATPQALYEGSELQRYNSAGSVDLDALFDELASLEGPDTQRPQFMQNLGFTPDMNLDDSVVSEFGHFDPIFNSYGLQGSGQTPGMHGSSTARPTGSRFEAG